MAGNEWVIKVSADVKGVLDASRQIGQAGKAAGKEFEQGFTGNNKILDLLRGQLQELSRDLGKTASGSKAAGQELQNGFKGSDGQVQALKDKVNSLNRALNQTGAEAKTAGKNIQQGLSGSENTIAGLRNKLTQLNQTLDTTAIGSKEFVATQKQIALTQRDVDGALGRGTGIMNSFGQALKGVAAQAAAYFGLFEAITFVGKAVSDLDTASAAVRTLGVDSEELSAAMLKLSVELDSNISRVELMKAAYDVASSGFSTTAQITEILKASAQGASGGFAELGDVAKALTGVINAYGLTTADAGKIVDMFVQTQADGVLTVREYAAEIGTVASVAAAAGIPLEELNAALATTTLKGVPVTQAVTGIRQAITAILKPSEQATDLANSLGISFDLSGLKARGFGGLLADVQAKTGGAADKLAILLGSVEAQAAIQPLLNDQLKTYNELLDNQVKSTGAAAKASEEATSTIAGGITKITNATSNFATVLAQSKSLSKIAESFGTLAKGIELTTAVVDKGVPGIIKALGLLVGAETLIGKRINEGREGWNELVINSAKWLTGLITGTTQLTVAQERQLAASIEADTVLNKLNQDLLDIQVEKNRLALIELDGTIALQAAKDKLYKTQADGLIDIRQADLNLGQALVGLEESRFSIIKNRNSFELKDAEERKASGAEIEELKRQGEVIEAAALSSKYQALVDQQELEKEILGLKQRQALVEVSKEVRKTNEDYRKAEIEYDNAKRANLNENNKLTEEALEKARQNLEYKDIDLQSANENLAILQEIQPLEGKSAEASRERAINGVLAEAAAKGLLLTSEGIFQKTKGAAGEFKTLGNSMKVPLGQQDAFTQLARDMGFAVRDTGKGYVEIGNDLNSTNKTAANDIKAYMRVVAESTQKAKTQTGGLANNMGTAANAAERFYNALANASGLPPARFTGGPVDAGQTYRVNDGPSGMSLGQEAFLSASGALSLINRPMNSLWTAPSRGTVIPAAMTSRLKESGALGGGAAVLRGGSDPAVAHLAVAVGNLSQEVAELRRKAWNVSVRGDGSGLRLAQTMARMR